ncbi:hypothetical protein ACFYMO_03740 [Streptomyces sp. NPDC007025]|uniref:hypothetical protein n=1 Tax=Streptomyces sp. NPDC007025 TaxID=3364771 RepID=UPI0036A91969
MTQHPSTPARDALYDALTTGVTHAQLRQHHIDQHAAEVRTVVRAETYHDAADEMEARQARTEHEERERFGGLDHETELQSAAVREMAAYLRKRAGQVRAATEEPTR